MLSIHRGGPAGRVWRSLERQGAQKVLCQPPGAGVTDGSGPTAVAGRSDPLPQRSGPREHRLALAGSLLTSKPQTTFLAIRSPENHP